MMVILISGCGSGLGLEMLRLYSKQPNFYIIGTARNHYLSFLKEEFKNKSNVFIKELDLTKTDSFSSLITEIIEKYKKIDILINNAAISYRAVVEHVEDYNEKLLYQKNLIN